MARNNKPTPQPASLSHDQMREAIEKINRRLKEIEAFVPQSITDRSDPSIRALQNRLTALLNSTFPTETLEYNQYRIQATRIDTAGINMNGTPIQRVREGLERGKAQTLMAWQTIRDLFQEELDDAGTGINQSGKALRAYQGLELHPEIERAVGQLFQNGHYANAIEDSVKALNALVRLRSGVELDGTKLMEQVFGGNPVLKFNDLKDQSDKDEQIGYMKMFSGAVSGLRNPRAHKLMIDEPERALEFIAFISLLAKLVDDAHR